MNQPKAPSAYIEPTLFEMPVFHTRSHQTRWHDRLLGLPLFGHQSADRSDALFPAVTFANAAFAKG